MPYEIEHRLIFINQLVAVKNLPLLGLLAGSWTTAVITASGITVV